MRLGKILYTNIFPMCEYRRIDNNNNIYRRTYGRRYMDQVKGKNNNNNIADGGVINSTMYSLNGNTSALMRECNEYQ